MQPFVRSLFCVLALAAISGCGPKPSGNDITFTTADGWTIHADFVAPANATKAAILLHQRAGSAEDWKLLIPRLNQAGVATLALDLRGAGRSTGPQNGDDAPWDVSPDIDGARKFLDEHGLKGKPVTLIGASYGANNALIYAASHPEIASVVLLSPGNDYHGLKVARPAKQYTGRIMVVSASADSITGTGPQAITDGGHVTNNLVYEGSEHGTNLFHAHPECLDSIASFAKR